MFATWRSPDFVRQVELWTFEPMEFEKMIAFLRTSPASRIGTSPRARPLVIRPPMIRANNHVERTNRKLRFFERSRYKWRRRRSIVRFLLLAFAHWRQTHATTTGFHQLNRQAASNLKPLSA